MPLYERVGVEMAECLGGGRLDDGWWRGDFFRKEMSKRQQRRGDENKGGPPIEARAKSRFLG